MGGIGFSIRIIAFYPTRFKPPPLPHRYRPTPDRLRTTRTHSRTHGADSMLNKTPSIFPFVLYTGLAALAFSVGEAVRTDAAGAFGFVLGCVFAGAGFFSLVEWGVDLAVRSYAQALAARAVTIEGTLAQNVKGMTSEQLQVFKMLVRDDQAQPWETGFGSQIGRIVVPDSFIRELVSESRGRSLVPERVYSDGSMKRQYYQSVVGFLIDRGLAEPPRGNQAAKITQPWPVVLKALREPEMEVGIVQ